MKALDLLNRVLEASGIEPSVEPDARGRVFLFLEGHDRPYRLSINFGEIADADRIVGEPVMQQVQTLQLRGDVLRVLFYVATQPDARVKRPSDVNGIITLKNRDQVEQAVITAIYANLPDVSEEQAQAVLTQAGLGDEEGERFDDEEPEEGEDGSAPGKALAGEAMPPDGATTTKPV